MNIIPTWSQARIPPCACRLLARNEGRDGRLMTDAELMEKTSWGKKHLRSVYQSASWEHITVGDMDLFLWACGLHPSKQRRYRWLLERASRNGMDSLRKVRHLRADVLWRANQVKVLLRMAERVLNEQRTDQRTESGI